jgi:hypothetical protein
MKTLLCPLCLTEQLALPLDFQTVRQVLAEHAPPEPALKYGFGLVNRDRMDRLEALDEFSTLIESDEDWMRNCRRGDVARKLIGLMASLYRDEGFLMEEFLRLHRKFVDGSATAIKPLTADMVPDVDNVVQAIALQDGMFKDAEEVITYLVRESRLPAGLFGCVRAAYLLSCQSCAAEREVRAPSKLLADAVPMFSADGPSAFIFKVEPRDYLLSEYSEMVNAFVREVRTTLLGHDRRGRPREVARNIRWLYRSRVRGETLRAMAEEEFDDPDRANKVGEAIRAIETLLTDPS